jgi:hypothetical protein
MLELHRKIHKVIHDHLQAVSRESKRLGSDRCGCEKMADHMSCHTNLHVCMIVKGLDHRVLIQISLCKGAICPKSMYNHKGDKF